MNASDILTLYDYNFWATRRILAACAQVSPEQFLAPTAPCVTTLPASPTTI